MQKVQSSRAPGKNWNVRVEGLQIVNGGQTCKTVQRALAENPSEDYSTASVLLRLYELAASDDDLIDRITYATNSQNPVDLPDLKSNDAIQDRLALGLRELGYDYKRKRDDQLVGMNTITSAVAAESVMSVWRRKPHAAKFRKSKLFGEFYDQVFSADLQAAHVVFSVIVFRYVENERKRPKATMSRYVPYASHFLAMVMGELLLHAARLDRAALDHQTIQNVRNVFDSKRSALYLQAVRRVGAALNQLGVTDTSPLPRVAAQFRRGDLIQPLTAALESTKRSASQSVSAPKALSKKKTKT